MKAEKAGEWAFLLCVIIAILAGLYVGIQAVAIPGAAWIGLVLVVLGVVVGLTTVTEKEITPFLIAVIALVVASAGNLFTAGLAGVTGLDVLGKIIDSILNYVAMFTAPAAIILSVKAIYALASKK